LKFRLIVVEENRKDAFFTPQGVAGANQTKSANG